MGGVWFHTTSWGLLAAGCGGDSALRRDVWGELFRRYRGPLMAYLTSCGYSWDEAEELVSGYFLRFHEEAFLSQVDASKGRFRSFLLASLKHHVANERKRARAQKRGGDHQRNARDVSELVGVPYTGADGRTPEQVYEYTWGRTVLQAAYERVERTYQGRGDGETFHTLACLLVPGEPAPSYAAAAEELHCSSDAVRQRAHRLREAYGKALVAEVAQTVASHVDIAEELRYLQKIFTDSGA